MSVPLPSLFARALAAASKAFNQPTIQDSTQVHPPYLVFCEINFYLQNLIQSSLKDLHTLDSRIVALSLFSPNESFEDISTRDLVYLLVPYVFAEVQGRVRMTEREERVLSLGQANVRCHNFYFSCFEEVRCDSDLYLCAEIFAGIFGSCGEL